MVMTWEQAREAVAMTQRLADEQANVSLFAFGVGRGVDKVSCGPVRYEQLIEDVAPWHAASMCMRPMRHTRAETCVMVLLAGSLASYKNGYLDPYGLHLLHPHTSTRF